MKDGKKNSINKTNAMRQLDAAKIPYSVLSYPVDEKDLSATHIAEQVGLPCGQVFKTIVTKGDRTGFLVFCIPADREIDLKAAAAATGNKRVEPLTVKELLGVTGYIRGGCSPIGMKKKFPTYFDSSVCEVEHLTISAGVRGMQLLLERDALLKFIGGIPADIAVRTGCLKT